MMKGNGMRDHPIILFDGVCNLCNSSVRYVIKHDPEHIFRFASLQSSFGQRVIAAYHLSLTDYNSFILFSGNKVYMRSTATLMVAKNLKGFVKFLYVLIIVPKFIRDGVYDIIAKNRYKWFGKETECLLPAAEIKGLFMEA